MSQHEIQRQLDHTTKDGSYFDERIEMYQSMYGELLQRYKREAPTGPDSQRMLENLKAYQKRIEELRNEREEVHSTD